MKSIFLSFVLGISLSVFSQIKQESIFYSDDQNLQIGYFHDGKLFGISDLDTMKVYDFSSPLTLASAEYYNLILGPNNDFTVTNNTTLHFIGVEEITLSRFDIPTSSGVSLTGTAETNSSTFHPEGGIAHDGKVYFIEGGDAIGGTPAKLIRFDPSETDTALMQKTLDETNLVNPRKIANDGNTLFIIQFDGKVKKIDDITATPLVISNFYNITGNFVNLTASNGKIFIELTNEIIYSPTTTANFTSYSDKTGYYSELFSFQNELYGLKDSKVMKFVDPIGIEETEVNVLEFYPNPTSGEIMFNGSVSDISILTIDGKNMYSNSKSVNSIDLEFLSKGTYFIHYLNKKNNKIVSKLVKK